MLNRRDPFPWQARLAEEVARTGEWRPVGVQTGLGKTACLDIAVWWLASQADRSPAQRDAPTRIWWVVNRRLLVDSTAEHAEAMANTLRWSDICHRLNQFARSDDLTGDERAEVARLQAEYRDVLNTDPPKLDGQSLKVAATVAARLRSLSADPTARPLQVIRLRGGLASRTPTDPSTPAILLCTLPMYGSRLLFRGYGSKLRAVDAAMAGTDSLVLLDEAHLAPHLTTLLPALADCTPAAHPFLGDARSTVRLVTLTATGDRTAVRPFELDGEDEAHPVVRQRLDAAKPLELRERTGDGARHLVEATCDLLRQADAPSACLVIANTPKTAREAFERLRKLYKADAELLLLTGLVREREAEHVRSRILDPTHGIAANHDVTVARSRHFIVVATQTLEVGADVDAEYLVTEACGVRALTQRLGRLNRLGRHPNSRAIYLHLPPPKVRGRSLANDEWPIYGGEPATVRQRLLDARRQDGTVDLAPRRVAQVLGPPSDHSSRMPEVLPGILWEWTKTTTPPEGEAPVEPYFSGIEGPQYTVSLMWRIHVPDEGQRLWPRALDREVVDVPIGEVREVLRNDQVHRLTGDGVTVETASGQRLRPGDRLILPTDGGLLDEFGWNPAACEPVVDMSLVGQGLPLHSEALERLCGVWIQQRLIDTCVGVGDEDVDQATRREAASEILRVVRDARAPAGWDNDEWTSFVKTLTPQVVEARKEVHRLRVEKPELESWSIDFDETSLAAEAVELTTHGAAVAERARGIARAIGLPSHLSELIERAGRTHDIGKADQRFQRWLDPEGKQDVLVAKSSTPRHRWEATRVAAGWPRGGRHEDLSARLVQAWLEQAPDLGDRVGGLPAEERDIARDLLLHLVISHHGKGRPLVRPVADDTLAEVCGLVDGVSVRAPANLSLVDWNQPARFKRLNDHFGPWGLALLEAIVIRADHAVSAVVDVD